MADLPAGGPQYLCFLIRANLAILALIFCTVLDCRGKRDATPLWHVTNASLARGRAVRPKAVSPLRSATAIHDAHGDAAAEKSIHGYRITEYLEPLLMSELETLGRAARAPIYFAGDDVRSLKLRFRFSHLCFSLRLVTSSPTSFTAFAVFPLRPGFSAALR